MRAMASQITGVSIVCSTVFQAQIKENIKAPCHCPLWGVSPHKGPVTRKQFPFDDVIMHCRRDCGPSFGRARGPKSDVTLDESFGTCNSNIVFLRSYHYQYHQYDSHKKIRSPPVWLSVVVHRMIPWWRHQKETFSALLAICVGNSPVPCEFPAQRPVTHSFDDFFDLRLNKRLSKQLWGWWFETPSVSLWRHCNAMLYFFEIMSMELFILISADSSRGASSWFDRGVQHVCKIFNEPKNWHDAEASCNSEFGHLASIVSITEDRDPIASNASVSHMRSNPLHVKLS